MTKTTLASVDPERVLPRRARLCVVTTVSLPMRVFLARHLRRLAEDFDIVLVCNATEAEVAGLLSSRISFKPMPIQRKPSLARDVYAFWCLWRYFSVEKFDVVYSIMPKSGLLAMTAAAAARVNRRVHCFTGQVWATRHDWTRVLFKALDRLLAACATHLLADSHSQAAFLEEEGVVRPGGVRVLGAGSIAGVDTSRFRPDPEARRQIRAQLALSDDGVVGIFVGRLDREKGLQELWQAYEAIAPRAPGLALVLVGPDEQGLREGFQRRLRPGMLVRFVDFTPAPEQFLAAADFFVLPSHREGFGTTVIEAAACGLPAIGSRIYGLTDAIVDGTTGILVPPRDAGMLSEAMFKLATNYAERIRLAAAARARVLAEFQTPRLTGLLAGFFQEIVHNDEKRH